MIGWLMMNNELEKLWEEVALTQLKALSWHSSWQTKRNHEKCQPGKPVSMPRFEHETSWIWVRGANQSVMMFSNRQASIGICDKLLVFIVSNFMCVSGLLVKVQIKYMWYANVMNKQDVKYNLWQFLFWWFHSICRS